MLVDHQAMSWFGLCPLLGKQLLGECCPACCVYKAAPDFRLLLANDEGILETRNPSSAAWNLGILSVGCVAAKSSTREVFVEASMGFELEKNSWHFGLDVAPSKA